MKNHNSPQPWTQCMALKIELLEPTKRTTNVIEIKAFRFSALRSRAFRPELSRVLTLLKSCIVYEPTIEEMWEEYKSKCGVHICKLTRYSSLTCQHVVITLQ